MDPPQKHAVSPTFACINYLHLMPGKTGWEWGMLPPSPVELEDDEGVQKLLS